MKKIYKALLLGAGFWGKRWIRLLKENERIEFAGIACTENQKDCILELSGLKEEQIYFDYEKAIEETEADIMINVLPAELHYAADKKAIEKGMNVITEKPLVKTKEQADDLIKLLDKRPDQIFMASQNYRWRPHNVTIKKALEDGMIGKLETIHFYFRRLEDLQGYRKDLERPLLDDMCIHHFDLIRFFSDSEYEEITARISRPSWSKYRGFPDVNAMIRMQNGIEVSYSGTWAARGMETSWDGDIVLCGSKGCLTLDADNQVSFYPAELEKEEVLATGRQKPILLENVDMKYEETEYGLYYFIDCMDQGKQPVTNLKDNYKSFSMVLACQDAADKK